MNISNSTKGRKHSLTSWWSQPKGGKRNDQSVRGSPGRGFTMRIHPQNAIGILMVLTRIGKVWALWQIANWELMQPMLLLAMPTSKMQESPDVVRFGRKESQLGWAVIRPQYFRIQYLTNQQQSFPPMFKCNPQWFSSLVDYSIYFRDPDLFPVHFTFLLLTIASKSSGPNKAGYPYLLSRRLRYKDYISCNHQQESD